MIPPTPSDDDPEQPVAEGRAGGDVEDEVADVDEAADRGQDPERDVEDPLHRDSARRLALSASNSRRSRMDAALPAEGDCASFASSARTTCAWA